MGEHPSTRFLDFQEEALHWSEEEKSIKPSHDLSWHAVVSDVVKQECNSPASSIPAMQQLADILLKQQKVIEDLTSALMKLARDARHRLQASKAMQQHSSD